MAEQNYKEFFDEAMKQIHEELKSSGNENEFILNFNLSYIEDTISEIKVEVQSKFLWDRMIQKGNIAKIQSKIYELCGQNINFVPVFNSKSAEIQKDISNNKKLTNDSLKTQEKNFSSDSLEYTLIPKAPVQAQLIPHPQLIEEYTFENFVPGDNSDYAYKACLAAAESPGRKNYNPILLYGPSGVGKTHLMVSIGNYIYNHNPKLKIAYTTTESLMNEFTAGIRTHTPEKFKKKYRNLDVLLLDDIQFLEKSEKLQDELFFTYEEIYKRKGQLVFTCDRPINEIKNIDGRLSSRFKNGPNIDLRAPDYETRLAILDKKLESQNRTLPQDVKELIAQNFKTNVRDLEGALTQMLNYAELMNKKLTIDIAREQLSDSINPSDAGLITVEAIQKAVSDYYNISVDDIKSKSRKKTFTIPRHIAIYLCLKLTEMAQEEIGQEFGGRDHSTIIASRDFIVTKLKLGDLAISDIIKSLTKQLKADN